MVPPDLDRLIDRAEGALRKAAVGRGTLPALAYVADGAGSFETVAFAVPGDDAGRDALAAVLAVHLDRVGARMWVLALPTRRRIGGRPRECALLDGQAVDGEKLVRRSRLLRVVRRRGVIAKVGGEDTTTHAARHGARHHPDGGEVRH